MVYRLVLISFLTAAVMLPLLWAAFAPPGARDMLESARVPPRAGAKQEAGAFPVPPDNDAKTEGRQLPGQNVDPTVMAPPALVQPSNAGGAADHVASEKSSSNVKQAIGAIAAPEARAVDGEAIAAPPEPSVRESAGNTVSAPPRPADSRAEPRIVKPSVGVRKKARRPVKGSRSANTSYRRDRRDGGWIAIMRDAKWLRDR
jgi:hypothetical protein